MPGCRSPNGLRAFNWLEPGPCFSVYSREPPWLSPDPETINFDRAPSPRQHDRAPAPTLRIPRSGLNSRKAQNQSQQESTQVGENGPAGGSSGKTSTRYSRVCPAYPTKAFGCLTARPTPRTALTASDCQCIVSRFSSSTRGSLVLSRGQYRIGAGRCPLVDRASRPFLHLPGTHRGKSPLYRVSVSRFLLRSLPKPDRWVASGKRGRRPQAQAATLQVRRGAKIHRRRANPTRRTTVASPSRAIPIAKACRE